MKQAIVTFVLAVVASLTSVAALGQESRKPEIVVVTHGRAAEPFWAEVKRGAEAAGVDFGANVDYRAPGTFDVEAMARLIDEAVTERPAGLVLSVPDADALAPHIRAAVATGIPVLGINSGLDVSHALGVKLHVGQNEYEAGRAAGEAMRDAGGRRAVCINHELGNIGLDLRCKGFIDGFGGSVEVLAVPPEPQKIEETLADRLKATESIDVVLALSASTAGDPALRAIAGSGRPEKIRFATFDISDPVLRALADGKADFAIDQQPFLQGYLPVEFLMLARREGVMPVASIRTGPRFVRAEEAKAALVRGATRKD
ncbi:sugar ABC transporter substrate-binding protein [Propylenella binzhouense]|uniref:Sugar ABC transporter substrate-binding protein n=1 Tax=Propylenella binzhouense TaxID=2555902 RepID=A0A964T3X2_9HYPH|nr:sugar ABC transporter substrate-binding protein [Propylenella binzhouense]MYZ47477.1 sugar ABC transporter substrate-binding protein [Propylenella binzhouense]